MKQDAHVVMTFDLVCDVCGAKAVGQIQPDDGRCSTPVGWWMALRVPARNADGPDGVRVCSSACAGVYDAAQHVPGCQCATCVS